MTLITRVSGTPDATLPRLLPSLGMSVDHFWHPRSYVPGASTWYDEIGGTALSVYLGAAGAVSDITVETVAGTGRPIVRTRSTANFGNGAIGASEIATVVVVAKPSSTDATAGTAPYYGLFTAQAGFVQPAGSSTVTTVPSTSTFTAAQDAWHMYAITNPTSKLFEFTIDGSSSVLGTAAGAQSTALAIGGKADTGSGKRELRVAAIITSRTVYSRAHLTGVVYPSIKKWFNDLNI